MEQSEAYLAVTGANASPGIYFYIWDFEVEEFALKSKTPKSVTSSVFWSNTDEDMFLLLSKEESKVFKNNVWTVVHTESVEVYILKDDLKLDHEINIHGISSFDTFKLFGETYILAVSRHLQTIYIIQYQGFNGFQVIQDLHVPGVDRVTVFCTQNDIFLAVSSNTGHTRILKCIIRGGKFIANQF
ncbi:uncharacterized protein CEXT_717831 [Caerostris extrusa]|uniref:Uncharacterized protein n=1 Tax=Caerostris extrusa TaxID=172846 RepID=A0AAV4SYM1_CAEEX|nr:uncharacterized protein CEXT_717831 [Caerostris extrusa]